MDVKQSNCVNGNNGGRQNSAGMHPDDLLRRQQLNKVKREFFKKKQLKIAAAIASRPEREKQYRYNSRFLCDECLKFGRPINANRKCLHLVQLERAEKLKKLKDADCCYRDKKSPIKIISNSLGYYLSTISNWVYLKLFVGVLKIHETEMVEKEPAPIKLVSGSERFFESIIFNNNNNNNNEDGDNNGDDNGDDNDDDDNDDDDNDDDNDDDGNNNNNNNNNSDGGGVRNDSGGDNTDDNGDRNTTLIENHQNIDVVSSGGESAIDGIHTINLLTTSIENSVNIIL